MKVFVEKKEDGYVYFSSSLENSTNVLCINCNLADNLLGVKLGIGEKAIYEFVPIIVKA